MPTSLPVVRLRAAERRPGSASIAPVGLEMADTDVDLEEVPRVAQTSSIRIPLRRRKLAGIVLGTVVACALILVAAAIARVSQASSPKESRSAPATIAAAAPVRAASEEAAPRIAAPAPAAEEPISGTVRIARPAAPGRVWLDGKKLTSNSALISCGAHQIRVGRGRVRSVQVPCGGELVISK